MAGEYSSWETVLGMIGYGGVGVASGYAVNLLSPDVDLTLTDGELALRAAGQYAGMLFVLTEGMRAVMPKRDSWMPPCSDSSALIGGFAASTRANQNFGELLRRYDKIGRETLGLTAPPPVPVSKEALNGQQQPVDPE